jgi:hypothetical protein
MTRDEMTGDEMTRDEMTGDEITRSLEKALSNNRSIMGQEADENTIFLLNIFSGLVALFFVL